MPNRNPTTTRWRWAVGLGFLLLFVIFAVPPIIRATEILPGLEADWGGHLRLRNSVSRYDDRSLFAAVGNRPYFDGSGELRLKSRIFFSASLLLETHYESIFAGGDTRKKRTALAQQFSALADRGFFPGPTNDDRRLLGLTGTITDGSGYAWYHRLDRLSLNWQPAWGSITAGRQALSWGNGLIFNPMDLFNPFSPTDIERDYKRGDDMLLVQTDWEMLGELQLLYVPRRDPNGGGIAADQASWAAKLHRSVGETEFDAMVARHYDDTVIGAGAVGYLGDAAWRVDTTLTLLNEDNSRNHFWSLTANLDYSWTVRGKNMYGLVEFYYNGLGHSSYQRALEDPLVADRITRGEIFTLGRTYLAAQLNIEIHPLVNLYTTVIQNLRDPSGTTQPRIVWDVTQNLQCTLGADLHNGSAGTEFGGFEIAESGFDLAPADRVFMWWAYFF